jgi:catalase
MNEIQSQRPNNTVPGTGLSPDKMLLARGSSYADAHRARLGVNYQQIPVNRPYYPNSFDDGSAADEVAYAEQAVLAADGEVVRADYTLHSEDDDFSQANTMINEVMDGAARERLVQMVSGLLAGLRRGEVVLQRAFAYLRSIDHSEGAHIEAAAFEKRRR